MSTETPEKTTPPATISSAQEFKKQSDDRTVGKVITLMNGLTVCIKRPSVNALIAQGVVPADVAAVFGKQTSGGTINTKDFAKLYELQQIIATHSLVEPKIVAEPNYDKGEIAVGDLDDITLGQIMAYVQSGVAELQSFRPDGQGGTA